MNDNEFLDKDTIEGLQNEEKKRTKSNSGVVRTSAFAQILNGDFLTKEFVINNLNFIFFIMLLLLLVVGKGYYGKQLSKDIDTAQKRLDEMTADFVEIKANMETSTRRYRLVQRLAPKGLVESEDSIKVIKIKIVEEN
ncbi:MAG: hypothetical protein RIT43_2258 [Bacteroidota bacterium]|jgi:hypothetical protein